MNITKGVFLCPKCNNNSITCGLFLFEDNKFRKWLCKFEYFNNFAERFFVIYDKEKKTNGCLFCCLPGITYCNVLDLSLKKNLGKFYPHCEILDKVEDKKILNYRRPAYYLEIIKKEISTKLDDEKFKFKCSSCGYPSKFGIIEFISDQKIKKEFLDKYSNISKKENSNLPNGNNEINEVLAINITSIDAKINFPIPCKKNDIFSNIEKRLYEEFPEYKNKNCYFIAKGNVIDRNKTIEENKIKSGDNILLNFI